jgi:hypothetical protein
MKVSAGTLVVLLALVCATTSRAAASTSPSSYLSQYIGVYNQLAGIVQSDKGNCVKMATDLKAWSVNNKATIASLGAEGQKISSLSLVLAALHYEGQIVADAQKLASNAANCAPNAQVGAALAAASKLKKP